MLQWQTWCLVRRRRMARVFFGLRSRGRYFLFLYASLSALFCFWDTTVRIWAMDFRTTLLQQKRKPRNQIRWNMEEEKDEDEMWKKNRNFYILLSLLGAPPVTLATRRRDSSVFKSLSWEIRSPFAFPRNSWTLILADRKEDRKINRWCNYKSREKMENTHPFLFLVPSDTASTVMQRS